MTPKSLAGAMIAPVLPNCRFDRAVFLLGHMRCGSTALSAILCQHPQISGYGEAHIKYGDAGALGILAANQIRRHAYRPGALRLFDKILHSRYDHCARPGFYQASAIFLIRRPHDAIRSIRDLFKRIGSSEYPSDAEAADHYQERLLSLGRVWTRFPPIRRIGLTYEGLTEGPDAALHAIGTMLSMDPPLRNAYRLAVGQLGHGAGDPLSAHRYDKIVKPDGNFATLPDLDLPPGRLAMLEDAYCELAMMFAQPV